jgi:hypothetical protein
MLMDALIRCGLVFAANMYVPPRQQLSGLAPGACPVGSPHEDEVVSHCVQSTEWLRHPSLAARRASSAPAAAPRATSTSTKRWRSS